MLPKWTVWPVMDEPMLGMKGPRSVGDVRDVFGTVVDQGQGTFGMVWVL